MGLASRRDIREYARMLVLLAHGRDNALRPEQELDFADFSDFCSWLQAQGHEIRGPEQPVSDDSDLKMGFSGALRPAAAVPMIPAWDRPVGVEEADLRFRARYGDDTEYRRRSREAFAASPAWVWLDLDDLTVDEWRDLQDEIDERGWDAIAYSSWSHGTDPAAVKCRLVLAADREYSPSEVRRVRIGVGRELGVQIDRSCTDASRLFYLPACPRWRADSRWMWRSEGRGAISISEVLESTPEGGAEVFARLELEGGRWAGQEASDEHTAVAHEALERWCTGIQRQAYGSFRAYTTQRAYRIGHYVGSGCLDMSQTESRMREAYARAREEWGDDQPVVYRHAQIRQGLSDGMRCPRLPLSFEALREVHAARDLEGVREMQEILEAQRPAEEIPLGEARERSRRHLSRATYPALTIDASTVGAGKSYLLAQVAAERARKGRLTVIQTQAHAVAAQTRAELHRQYPEVRSAHLFSAASAPSGEESCPRIPRDPELREMVRDYGVPLRRICATGCPLATGCPALAAARRRDEMAGVASVLFVSQAGISQASDLLGDGAALFSDESPEPLTGLSVPPEVVSRILSSQRIPGVGTVDADDLRDALRAVADDLPADGYTPIPHPSYGALRALSAEDRSYLRSATRLSQIIASGSAHFGSAGSVEGYMASASWEAMISARESVLVDATPPWYALPASADVLRQCVADPFGVTVSREMIYLGRAGTGALCPVDGEIAEREVMAAIDRARRLPGRVLFVTFPAIRRWLETTGRWPAGSIAHYGATRGRNDWQDYDGVYCLGTPRYAREPGLRALLRREDVSREWAYLAQAELDQALGRLRHVSSRRDLRMVVEGNLPPLGWHSGNARVVRACDFG